MGEISVRDGVLHIALSVPERLLAVHGRDIAVPLAQITDAVAVPDAFAAVRGLRMPGGAIPGVVAVGTWRGHDDDDTAFRDFVLVHHSGPGVVVSVADGDYDRIVIGTEQPEALRREIGWEDRTA